jgi:D-sedoheptulose 7-phosphate isomerase
LNDHIKTYLSQAAEICAKTDGGTVETIVDGLVDLRQRGGRLFILGVGDSAANAGHAVNDFRKLCGIEAYAPTDNVAELTARTNDEGWETVFANWLAVSPAGERDALLIFSVGGGSSERNVSVNLVRAIAYAREKGLKIFGVVGRDGGDTKRRGDTVLVVPTVDEAVVHAAYGGLSSSGPARHGLSSQVAGEQVGEHFQGLENGGLG